MNFFKKNTYFVLAVTFVAAMICFFVINNVQHSFAIVGLKFEGTTVSTYNRVALDQLVKQKIAQNNKQLILSYAGKQFVINPFDVGYAPNALVVANKIIQTGRTGNIFQRLLTQAKALLGFENVKVSSNISQALLTIQLLEIRDAINHDPIPAHPDFVHDIATTLAATPGVQVDSIKLAALIVQNVSNPPQNTITIPVNLITPRAYSNETIKQIRDQAIKLTESPISISSGGQVFTLTPKDLLEMLTVVERPDPKNAKQTMLVLRIDDILLNRKLGDFAEKVENITGAEFNEHDARIAIYKQFYSGNHAIAIVPTGGRVLSKNVLAAATNTQTQTKIAYLTFDDGPNTIYQPLILDILKQYGIKATFFMIGQNIPAAHDDAVQTLKDGNIVGNHSYTHAFLPSYSSEFIQNELVKTDNVLMSINGNVPVALFRPPYGGMDADVISDAHKDNLRIFLWDVDPRDWSEPDVDTLIARVINAVHDGSNILMHSNHLVTVRALPKIIQTLKSEGYTFQTLSNYPKPEEY